MKQERWKVALAVIFLLASGFGTVIYIMTER